jgi:hypothetical protein
VVLLAEGGGQRDWDLLQSLRQPHHDAKTRRGRRAREDPSALTLRFKTTNYCRHDGQRLGGQVPGCGRRQHEHTKPKCYLC